VILENFVLFVRKRVLWTLGSAKDWWNPQDVLTSPPLRTDFLPGGQVPRKGRQPSKNPINVLISLVSSPDETRRRFNNISAVIKTINRVWVKRLRYRLNAVKLRNLDEREKWKDEQQKFWKFSVMVSFLMRPTQQCREICYSYLKRGKSVTFVKRGFMADRGRSTFICLYLHVQNLSVCINLHY